MSATINETLTLPKFGETVRLAIGILIGVFLLGNTFLGAQMVIWLSALTLVLGGIAAIIVAFRARS